MKISIDVGKGEFNERVIDTDVQPLYGNDDDLQFFVRVVMPDGRSVDVVRSVVSLSRAGCIGTEITMKLSEFKKLQKIVDSQVRQIISGEFGNEK